MNSNFKGWEGFKYVSPAPQRVRSNHSEMPHNERTPKETANAEPKGKKRKATPEYNLNLNLTQNGIRLWVRFHDGFLQAQKLRLAQFLHDRFPARFCWADCVAYGYGVFKLNPLKIEGCKGCKTESEQNTTCYCGQWCNGRLWRDLTPNEQLEARGEAQPSSVIFES